MLEENISGWLVEYLELRYAAAEVEGLVPKQIYSGEVGGIRIRKPQSDMHFGTIPL